MEMIINMQQFAGLKKVIEKELVNNKILLVSFKSKDYREGLKNLLEFSLNKYKKSCYVTLNDPHESIVRKLNERQLSKMFFIDCVTCSIKTPKQEENVVFVSSPRALTEISIAIKKAIDMGGMESLILDSISAMLVYEQSLNVMKFVHKQVLALREANLICYLIIMREDVSEELMKDLAMFVDKIVEAD
ncbi:MAG: hypothetical protein JXC85_05045 [Candidatus Aenigmarchaeota archaeon]|nr:hypothetical protein [Candidatus Aenigmarchaeota archaeon]